MTRRDRGALVMPFVEADGAVAFVSICQELLKGVIGVAAFDGCGFDLPIARRGHHHHSACRPLSVCKTPRPGNALMPDDNDHAMRSEARSCDTPGCMPHPVPLARIAELTGFDHHEYLNVAFKREVGRTPGQYRSETTSPRAVGTEKA